jgi:hypothetical protein
MAKLLGLLLFVGALIAAAMLVPVGGRTVQDRWRASRGAADFASRSWHEVAVAAGLEDPPRRPLARQGRQASPAASPAPASRPRPVERISEADRAALERVVSERAR